MRLKASLLGVAVLLAASTVMATSFVVPTDEEMIAKSPVIVIGTVEGAYVQENGTSIETVYEIRVERAIKGLPRANELVRVVSQGGVLGERGLLVEGEAHFSNGERVLLFLSRHRGQLRTTDMTLGKFRFVTSTAGERLLVREMEDVVGWDHAGRVHKETVRREAGFLRFIEGHLKGVPESRDYAVEASQVTLPPEKSDDPVMIENAPFPGWTYSAWSSGMPIRWPNIAAGVTFRKSPQNIAGVADGGVSTIQNALAAWTNECASVVNLIYGGATSTQSADFDGINVVEFGDPQNKIGGTWGGSGTIALTFISFTGNPHEFEGRQWQPISSADAVFQDGFPGTHSAFAPGMTHEIGHAIGFRHSNQDYETAGACIAAREECTTTAIMNSTVSGNYGFTLQPWDVNAVQSIYPGGFCGPTCIAPGISSQPQSRTITSGSNTTLSVTATGSTPLSYQWYIGASGNTSQPFPGGTGPSITVSPSVTTSYWVRVSNACGTVDSAAATVTVQPAPPARRTRGDYNGDGRTDPTIFRPQNATWYSNGGFPGAVQWGVNTDQPVPADYDGDGRTDIAVWRPSTGLWIIRHSSTGALFTMTWGQNGDIPLPHDYNGDGRADITVWRPSSGTWYSNGGIAGALVWGVNGDVPVPADYNGDGRVDVAVWRPSTGTWYAQTGLSGAVVWGVAGDVPLPADYNGDGRADITVWRPSTGTWYSNGGFGGAVVWGQAGDQAVPGDYDGNGTIDIAVWRPSNGIWYIRNLPGVFWGQNGDIPLSQ